MRFRGISSEVYVYAVPTQGIPEIVKQNLFGYCMIRPNWF